MSDKLVGAPRIRCQNLQRCATNPSSLKDKGVRSGSASRKPHYCPMCKDEVQEPGLCTECRIDLEEQKREAKRELCAAFEVPAFRLLPEDTRHNFTEFWKKAARRVR